MKLSDVLWPKLGGWHVVPLALAIGLTIIVIPLMISQAIDRLFR